jgi:hypothetical protein
MNVYRVDADCDYGLLPVVEDELVDFWCEKAAGKPSATNWRVPTMLVEPDRDFVPVDCVCSAVTPGRGLLLNRRAREALGELLSPCGEFLPVRLGRYDYQWFNCTVTVDAIDQEKMEGAPAKPPVPPGSWRNITRWAFKPEALAQPSVIFGLPRQRPNLLCTDVLKSAVEGADLLGFEFQLLWSSETGGVAIDPGPPAMFGEAARERVEQERRKREAALARLAQAS